MSRAGGSTMENVLVTGALGQIGSELTPTLRGADWTGTVVASDVQDGDVGSPFETIDVTRAEEIEAAVIEYDVDTIFHLAAILSANGEQRPQLALDVNVNGFLNVLEVARNGDVEKVVVPSSIAVFGPDTPPEPTERTILNPTTVYGISKVFGEQLGQWYYDTHDLDVRGVRLPGIISHETLPGGGTTDYAVEVFYEALETGSYTYFVRPDTRLPMMYMPDAIRALIGIGRADSSALTDRCSYNVGALSFTAAELTAAIKTHLPEFEASYEPDDRQEIADTWPADVDDSAARSEWGWEPRYDLSETVADMLDHLSRK